MVEVSSLNIVTVNVKKFDKHMVVADYNITLQSTDEKVEHLINRIPKVQENLGL